MTYKVHTLTTGLFSGNLNPTRLEAALNEHAAQGWKFARSIHETKRAWLIFSREVHFLIFERSQVS